jgi:hypothetical protein
MFEVEQICANKHRHLVDEQIPLFPRNSSTTQLATKRYGRRRPRRRRRPQRHTCSRSASAPKVVQDGHPFMHDTPDSTVSLFPPQPKLTLKIPPNMHTRSTRSASRRSSAASGSEYHASEKSVDMEEPPLPEPEPKEETPEIVQTRSGRSVRRQTYVESSDADGDGDDELPVAADELFDDTKVRKVTRSSSRRQQNSADAEDEDEDSNPGRYPRRQKPTVRLDGFIVVDEDDEMNGGYATRTRAKRLASKVNGGAPQPSQKEKQQAQRAQRNQRREALRRGASKAEVEDDFFPDHTSSAASADADGSLDDAPHTSSDLEPIPEPEPEPEPEDEGDGKPYSLRQRKDVNYAIPPPLEDLAKPPPRHGGGRNGRNGGGANAKGKGRLGWSASGAELGRWMGMPAAGDDSVSLFLSPSDILLSHDRPPQDSDYPTRTPRKPFGGINPYGGSAMAGGGMLGGEIAAGGTPSNLGKIGDSGSFSHIRYNSETDKVYYYYSPCGC